MRSDGARLRVRVEEAEVGGHEREVWPPLRGVLIQLACGPLRTLGRPGGRGGTVQAAVPRRRPEPGARLVSRPKEQAVLRPSRLAEQPQVHRVCTPRALAALDGVPRLAHELGRRPGTRAAREGAGCARASDATRPRRDASTATCREHARAEAAVTEPQGGLFTLLARQVAAPSGWSDEPHAGQPCAVPRLIGAGHPA